ncbi:hypothetical protein ON010_g4956 [Phytophthora cinnamomi]|nr:hypothetical protein ON010_g4956 [Phytophthora cinnamomi]
MRPNEQQQRPLISDLPPDQSGTRGASIQDHNAFADPEIIAENMQRIVEKAVVLEEDVARLRQEIQQLERKQCDITNGVVMKTTPWKIVAEYYRIFRNGYKPPTANTNAASGTAPMVLDKDNVYRRFLQTGIARDVIFNGGSGVEAVLENWRLVSLHHDEMDIELVRMEGGPGGSIVATVNGLTTITVNMLQIALPHLGHDGEDGSIASKIAGQQIGIPSIVRIGWDPCQAHLWPAEQASQSDAAQRLWLACSRPEA